MQKRKVWKLYASLSKPERRQFLRELKKELPPGSLLLRLARGIHQALKKGQQLNEHQLWHKLYPHRDFDDPQFRKVCTALGKKLTHFLAMQELLAENLTLDGYYLQALSKRKLPQIFEESYGRLRKKLDRQPLDADYFHHLFRMQRCYFQHQQLYHCPIKKKQAQLEGLNQAFDAWWIHEKLGLACTNITFNLVSGLHIDTPLLDEALTYIKTHPQYEQMLSFQLIYQLLRLLKKEHGVSAEAIKSRIQTHKDQLNKHSLASMVMLLANYYIRKLNLSAAAADAHNLFALYEWAIEEKLLFQDGYLSAEEYKNLINLCRKLNELERATTYLEKYKSLLPATIREDAYRLNQALILFDQGAFMPVIELERSHRFANKFYDIQVRVLALEAQYEHWGHAQEELTGKIDSLIRHLYNQQLETSYRNLYIIRLRMLSRLSNASGKAQLQKLRKSVLKAKHLNNRQWLLEKIDERLQGKD